MTGSASAAWYCGIGDRAGLVHPPQHIRATGRGAFGARDRVQVGRPLRNAREYRGFGHRELVQVLAEVSARRGDDAIGPLAEEIGVEIELEDLLLREFALDPKREDPLLELVDEALQAGAQARPREHVERAGDLLGDRAAADAAAVRGDLVDDAAQHAAIVDSGVLEEVLVLGGENGLDQERRNVGIGHRRSLDLAVLRNQAAVAAEHL